MRCVQRGGDAGDGGEANPRGRCSAAVASPRPWSGYFAPRTRIQGGMGDVVEEARLDVDRDGRRRSGSRRGPIPLPASLADPDQDGNPTFARAGEGLQGTQAPIRGSMSGRVLNGTSIFPNPRATRRDVRRCLSSRDLKSTSQTMRDGICDTILVRLVLDIDATGQAAASPLLLQGTRGHSRDFEIPNSWLKKSIRHLKSQAILQRDECLG